VSDEPEFDGVVPEPLSDLGFGANPAPLVPAQPQFASRREARDASGVVRRPSSRKPTGSPASRSSKLSRRDQAAIKRLAATPLIVPVAPITPSPSNKPKKQNPFKVMFALLVISGFVGGVALPAAASGNGLSNAAGVTTSYKHAQSVKISANIETSKVSRDAVSATSEAELRTEQINARQLADDPGVRQPGDDYPWRDAGYSLSPLGYYYRQCVDFVAWRLNRDQGVTAAPWKWVWSNLTPWGGDAADWKAAWQRHGWTVSATPIVGSVAWFVGDHVAYVHSISGSNVTIEEYNGEASRAYAIRTIPISTVGDFLYPPH
jgi:peptidoglycan DL-endopeptidase CwlO